MKKALVLSLLLTGLVLAGKPAAAQIEVSELETITPENVQNLQFLTGIGHGTFSGGIAWQPNGDLIAAAAGTGVAFLDRTTAEQTGFIPTGFQPTALSASPDGQRLAVAYNVPTGNTTGSLAEPEYARRISLISLSDEDQATEEISDLQECGGSNIQEIAFTPDGNYLVFEKKHIFQEQKLFCVLSVKDRKISQTMEIPENADSAISPDGRFAAVVPRDREYKANSATIYTFPDFDPVTEIQFDPVLWPTPSFTHQGIFVLRDFEESTDSGPHRLRFWSVPAKEPFAIILEADQVTVAALPGITHGIAYDQILSQDLSPNSQWIVTGSRNGIVKLWNAATGQFVRELGKLTWISHNLVENPGGVQSSQSNSAIASVLFSPDGMTVSATESLTLFGQAGQIHLFSLHDDSGTLIFNGESVGNSDIDIGFSPDSSRLVYGGFADGHAEVHAVPGGELVLRLTGHSATVNQAMYAPDGSIIATASDDATIRLWNAKSGSELHVLTGHTGRVTRITFSPDGQWLVSAAEDNTLRRWQIEDGALIEIHALGENNWQFELLHVLSDNQSIVYVAVAYPSSLTGYVIRQMVWDLENGGETQIGEGNVTLSSVAQDGQTFAGYTNNDGNKVIGTLDNSGRITLRATGIRSPYANGGLGTPVVSPDGRLLISGNIFGLQAWELGESGAAIIGRVAAEEPIPAYGNLYKISPDGKILALAYNGVIYLLGIPAE